MKWLLFEAPTKYSDLYESTSEYFGGFHVIKIDALENGITSTDITAPNSESFQQINGLTTNRVSCSK